MAKQRHPVKITSLPVYANRLSEITQPLDDVTLIVPSSDLLLTTVTLPKLPRHRLLQALPYALEEQLIEEVSFLHFATGPRDEEGRWPVAVVAIAKMEGWLEAAKAAGLSLIRMVPDVLTLPLMPRHWTLDLCESWCTVRTGPYSGFSCHRETLPTFLEAALKDPLTQPDGILVRTFSGSADLPANAFPGIRLERIQMDSAEEAASAKEVLMASPCLNLLQGRFSPRSTASGANRLWQAALSLAFIGAILLVVTKATLLLMLRHTSAGLQQEIAAIYTRHFPSATAMVAPKARMSEKLHHLESEGSESLFLELLAKTTAPLSRSPEVRLEWIDYQNRQLKLGLTAPSFNSLDELTSALNAAGLKAKQQNAATSTGNVKATLLVRSAS